MEFEKDVTFLGCTQSQFTARDTGEVMDMYSIQLYDSASAGVTVNVIRNLDNAAMLATLTDLSFGTLVHVTFVLRPREKLYRLGIKDVVVK